MQISSVPKKLPVPFADNGDKQTIPVESQVGITGGRASYSTGFPPLTRTPLSAGGIPPFGTDFNGVLNEITAAIRWGNAGAGYAFDSSFATSISGYPKGALLPNSVGDGFWLNTTDANSNSPENATAALTGWVPVNSYGSTAITGLSSSSVTLTTLQASKNTIILAGSLTSNINLIAPAWLKTWEIVNNCTGAYSVTVKTPAGTGVAVPTGSNARLQGDGTNINQAAAPGSLLGSPQIFTTSGTYTPTPGTKVAEIEIIGAGGGGGGTGATSSSTAAVASGGNSGAAAKKRILNPVITSVVIGIGGAGGIGDNPGSAGGASSFGTIISAPGGKGGLKVTLTSSSAVVSACAAATEIATGGDINFKSGQGSYGTIAIVGSGWSGKGGDSIFGPGGGGVYKSDGISAVNPGAGGGGSHDESGGPARIGGKGANGICIIREYA
ncbi:hypothetical protein [Pantoea sp. CCBC3-3-1]|uniref:glycine-rich domain-containing protein n=1 Tax=Pantoea sp. CCBC3-3-1 TaxID=2490851 RepID=UPI0015806CEA|nr:hypothetical protein [Pantoea sp. CCBC3-3-1]